MSCDICKKEKSLLSSRGFDRGEFDEPSQRPWVWYCEECAEAEKQTEPWKRGYMTGFDKGIAKRDQKRLGLCIKTALCTGVVVSFITSILWLVIINRYYG